MSASPFPRSQIPSNGKLELGKLFFQLLQFESEECSFDDVRKYGKL